MQSTTNVHEVVADQNESSTSQWLIEQYELQHSMQNSTKNYVCAPLQSLEAAYVEQFRKMSQRDAVLKEVPVCESNRFDVSSRLKLPEEESQSLEELVKAFRTRKLQRVAALRKNQTVCEESVRTQFKYALRELKALVVNKMRDTLSEVRFALKQFSLYSS